MPIKTLTALCISIFMTTGWACTKSNDSTPLNVPEIEAGTYTGLLVNMPTSGLSTPNFKVSVLKTGDATYLIKQVTAAVLPEFHLTLNQPITTQDIQLAQGGYFKGTIPLQTSGSATVKGDGATTGEEDASYYNGQKRLVFVIQINNSGIRVGFSGVKD